MLAIASTVCVLLTTPLLLAAPGLAAERPGDGATASATRTVRLKDSFFSPSRVTVARGGSVRFVWAGQRAHNLIGPGVPARLEDPVRRRRPFTRVFRRSGRVSFICSIHPGMEMTVRVR
jgi:plastocyanin